MPSLPCVHGRRRSRCKECGGGSICDHGRRRDRCKECGGSHICPHGRQRSQCKECGGKSICPHGRQRSQCKECGGKSICPHGRIRSVCKECGGGSICPHGRIRSRCKECGQSSGPKRKAAEAMCEPADCPPTQPKKVVRLEPERRPADVSMCLPTLEHDDKEHLVIDGFVVRCGATRAELDGL